MNEPVYPAMNNPNWVGVLPPPMSLGFVLKSFADVHIQSHAICRTICFSKCRLKLLTEGLHRGYMGYISAPIMDLNPKPETLYLHNQIEHDVEATICRPSTSGEAFHMQCADLGFRV